MTKAKKKLLPQNFEDLLKEGDIEKLKAVFDTCIIDARGGYLRQTALAFNECPDEFARWLVEHGADISASDRCGGTPLHTRAGHWQGRLEILLELGADVCLRDKRGNTPLHNTAAVYNVETVSLLLKHGASADALNDDNLTPLKHALQRCSNINIPGMAEVAEVLLNSRQTSDKLFSRLLGFARGGSAVVSRDMKDLVLRIGKEFEFHRSSFNPDFLDTTSAALDQLYLMFDVPPVPHRTQYDGKSPIIAKAKGWEDRHQELWELLVPSRGAADTIQGEVIRVSGKIHDEFERNGASNWDADFKKLADAFLSYIETGVPLSEDEKIEASSVIAEVKRRSGNTSRICELAVSWVALNPRPLKLPPPEYDR